MATVRDTSTENKIDIVTTTENNVTVTQPVTSVVTVSALGPQGAVGPQGPTGPLPNTGSFVLTSSFNAFTSSYYIDSASFEIQILSNSSSIELLSGSFETTSGSFSTRITDLENFSSSLDATFATEAELNLATASLSASISYLSSSFEIFSGSYNTGSFSGSFEGNLIGTSSYSINSISASYALQALSASYAANVPLTASYALQALSASYAVSASYEIIKEVSSSHADFADTASLAYTASSADQFNVRTALTASGIIYPTTDGEQYSLIQTDGAGNLSFDFADKLTINVKNTSGALISAGTPVYISGFQGAGIYQISPASASNAAKMPAIGLTRTALAINEEGKVVVQGAIRNINTNILGVVGTKVYVGANGGLTATRPTGNNLIQNLGVIARQANNGTIILTNPGRSNDVPNLSTGYVWIGNGSQIATPTPTSSIQNVVSSSYTLTASYLDNYVEPFPYTGSALITGSLGVTGSLTVTNDITSLNNISVLGTVNSLNTAGILDLSNGFDGTSDVLLGADNGTYNAGWVYLVSGSSNGNYAQMGTGGSNGLGISINDRKGATTSWSSWNHIMIGDNLNDYTISQSYPAAVTINVDNLTFNSGVSRSVALGGTGYVVDTSDTAFMQNARIINAITASSALISGSGNQQLTLIGSGSSQPIFRVQGSEGELFSITDSLSGSLFAINNISGLPILEVFSDDRIIQGDYVAPMLTTTVKNTVSAVGAFTVYELPTASYDGAFFEYTARSGSNARAGQIMSIWSGSQVNFTETTTTDFGSTTGLAFTMIVTGSNFALTGSVTTADWTIKTIVRSI